MAMNQVIGRVNYEDETVLAGGHPPVVMTGKVAANDGAYPFGMLLGEGDSVLVPFIVETEAVAAGNGSATSFSDTIAHHPIEPGSLTIADSTETFSDDGNGRLVGSAGGSGTVNYKTGAFAVTFDAAPSNADPINAVNHNELVGVQEKATDTALDTGVNYVVHGSVRRDRLKKGKEGAAVPDADITRLQKMGIYPV